MVDIFVLIMSPGAGDELQGIKRGIMEIADLVLVNKADGDLLPAARRAAAEIESAFHYLRPKSKSWRPRVQLVSALTMSGIDLAWTTINEFHEAMNSSGEFGKLRRAQVLSWFHHELSLELNSALLRSAKSRIAAAESDVLKGKVLASVAARRLVGHFISDKT
jgi:LAO/AO transport system kinase